MRLAFATAALIEQNYFERLGIKELAVNRQASGAGPAVQEDNRLAFRIARAFVGQRVTISSLKLGLQIRLDWRI